MTEIVLYHFPGACSQVCLYALEEAKLSYEVRLVDITTGQQSAPAYAAISPLGKVPALVVDGIIITENASIQTYIAELCPEAGLFPADRSPLALAHRYSGLSFCGAGLQPFVRGVVAPSRLTDGDGEPVRTRSTAMLKKYFGYAEQHMAESGWWLGEFSLVDVYLNWNVLVATYGKFDMSGFPILTGLQDRLLERPAFARIMQQEARFRAQLEEERKRTAV